MRSCNEPETEGQNEVSLILSLSCTITTCLCFSDLIGSYLFVLDPTDDESDSETPERWKGKLVELEKGFRYFISSHFMAY